MKAKLCSWKDVDEAVKALQDGALVAFPTETVYGLGAIASSKEAFDRLVEAKRRPADKPFTLMVSSLTEIAMFAEINAQIVAVAKKFMPGPLTLLLKARKGIPSHIDLGTGVIGVRFPDDENVVNLIEKVGCPLLVPSANRSGEKPLTSGKEVHREFLNEACIVFDGEIQGGVPSTIVDLSKPGEISLVRQGSLPFASIEEEFNNCVPQRIALASDHGGFAYKEKAKIHLMEQGHEVIDFGCDSTSSCDYPLFAFAAAKAVAREECEKGILICTSGEGISMAANKIKGIRCGIGYDDVATGKTVEHNHANMVAFGQKYMKEEDVLRRIDIFLIEKPSKLEKHARRVREIEEAE